jgi:hypothetical protein
MISMSRRPFGALETFRDTLRGPDLAGVASS